MKCDAILYLVFFIIVFFFSAVSHEADLARNFAKTGDAGAWFFEIKR